MRTRTLITLLATIALFCSCGVSRKQNVVSPKQDAVLKPSEQESVGYTTFAAQYKGSFNSIPFKLQVRASHDSIIWCSVSALLGEVARGKLTCDSIYALDKINSEAYIIAKSTLTEAGKSFDNKTIEKFLTDTVDAQMQFGLTKPLVAEVSVKKKVQSGSMPVYELEATISKHKYKLKLTQTDINFDTPQQYPFTIPAQYSIKRR
ncbi:MAG: DUF4292 domain-containing protein [Candidatus Onthomorpha sp.]|nr:DUF4292 domain-containing protein [Bacteroidales bacterium]MDD7485313.1 DUF4292 domain-containing protein [Bacteroidales bacterium]MDY5698719.1 DUF4292 domain-containing protein [Candidatus Onthomorpha sp.]